MATRTRAATPKMINFIVKLAGERDWGEDRNPGVRNVNKDAIRAALAGEDVEFRMARDAIDYLLNDTVKIASQRGEDKIAITEPGVYETKDGIFVVQRTRDQQRLYAKQLVEIAGDRVTETGWSVNFEFVYARGAIFKIQPDDKMPFERAKQLTIKYGRCIRCGRKLKAKVSVERGIGPVCRKYFV